MPANYYVYPRRRVAILSWTSGLPDLAGWCGLFDALLADPAFGEGFGVVSDWRTAVEAPSAAFVDGAIEHASRFPRASGLRWAAVMPPAAAMIEAGLTAERLATAKGLVYRSFTDFRAAVEWAGRTEDG